MFHCRFSKCVLLTTLKHCKLKHCNILKRNMVNLPQALCVEQMLISHVHPLLSKHQTVSGDCNLNKFCKQYVDAKRHSTSISESQQKKRRSLEKVLVNEAESNHYVFEKNQSYHKWIMSVEPDWLADKRHQTQEKFINITTTGGKLLPNLSMFETLLGPVSEESFSFREIADLLWKLSWLPPYQLLPLIKVDKFQNLMAKISENIHSLTDEELFVMNKCLSALPFRRALAHESTPVHEIFVQKLSTECTARMKGWDADTCLWVADVFFWLRAYPPMYNSKSYVHEILSKLRNDWDTLSKEQVVLAIFYISLARKCPQDFLLNLEKKVLEFWPKYSIDEKANICIGFFKAEHHIRSQDLLLKIVGTLRNNLVHMDDLMLGGVCKLVNHSLTDNLSNECIYKVMYSISVFLSSEKLLTRIPRMNVVTIWRLMKLAGTVTEASVPFLEGIKYVVKTADVSKWRLKDICWIVFLLGKFQISRDDSEMQALLYDKLHEELHKDRRLTEMKHFPYSLPLAIMGFIHMEIFPQNLMDIVMDKEYIQLLKG